MRPKEHREAGQDLFCAQLDQIIDLDHALVKLARAIGKDGVQRSAAVKRGPHNLKASLVRTTFSASGKE
jgi:hypothetical protein